jgi:hypothetical protein
MVAFLASKVGFMSVIFSPRAFGRRAFAAGLTCAAATCIGGITAAVAAPSAIAGPVPGMLARADLGLGALAPALPAPIKLQGSVPVAAELPPCDALAAAQAPPAPAGDAGSEARGTDGDQADARKQAGAAVKQEAGKEPGGAVQQEAGKEPGGAVQQEAGKEPGNDASRDAGKAAALPDGGVSASVDASRADRTIPPVPAVAGDEIPADGAADAGEAKLACGGAPPQAESDADDKQQYQLGYESPDPGAPSPVRWVRPLGAPKPWFSGVSTDEGIVTGDRNLTYRSAEGPSLSVGSLTPFTPAWGSAAPIGGVQVSNLTAASDATVPEGKLGYSSMFGRMDNTDASTTQGGMDYGRTVGTGSLRYGLTPELTLESQVQTAPSLSATGVGTTYSVGPWGTVQAGVTQSRFDTSEAMRYRLGYNVDVLDALTLGYANEQTGAGYGDLSTYSTGATTDRQVRNTFSAGVPVGSWGRLSGTYSGLREADGVLSERRYGLSQSVVVGPGLRFAVGADHDAVSGDYAVNFQLSVPMGR